MVVIAIDGPSGSGKSSVSRALAQEFGWAYLDTGALYRTLTLLALQSKAEFLACISESNSQGSEPINWIGDPRDPQVLLKGERVNTLIRSQEITDRVSEIAANPQVRSYLLEIQRTLINQATRGIVVEGRDIGTTVWPDAELKIFLTADLEARAARRSAELQDQNNEREVGQSLAQRDAIDSSRSISPLRQVDDQIVVDATHLTLAEVVAEISKKIKELRLMNDGANNE